MNARTQILQLRSTLKRYADHYYQQETPLVSDAVYDTLFNQLQVLEANHPEIVKALNEPSILDQVGSPVTSRLVSKPHSHPMLSLKTETDYTESGVRRYLERITGELGHTPEIAAELKYDGLGLSLRYEKGQLVEALTRGDGQTGEDVLLSTLYVPTIPTTLKEHPDTLSVRGEVLLDRNAFEEINTYRVKLGEKPFVNCRNAAAGIIRRLEPDLFLLSRLRFIAYQVLEPEISLPGTKTHMESLSRIAVYGFHTSLLYHGACLGDIESILQWRRRIEEERVNLPVEIDGVVYKVNDYQEQLTLGYASREPRWAIAHKFRPEVGISQLLAVDYQVGRTGVITPVAKIEPVFVGGVTVTSVTLHNYCEIERLGIWIGDRILVQRAGDVVPEILGLSPDNVRTTQVPISLPAECPSCCGPVVHRVKEGIIQDILCINPACPAQLQRLIEHGCSQVALDIRGLGKETIALLIESQLVKNIADVMSLTAHDLGGLGLGERTIDNLIQAIEKAKETRLYRLLVAMGIPEIGVGSARDLERRYKRPEILVAAIASGQLGKDFPPSMTASLTAWWCDSAKAGVFYRLAGAVKLPEIDPEALAEHPLKGKRICLTGGVGISREVIHNRLESIGAIPCTGVTRDLDLLVAGTGATQSKVEKAVKMGKEVIDGGTFLSRLGILC